MGRHIAHMERRARRGQVAARRREAQMGKSALALQHDEQARGLGHLSPPAPRRAMHAPDIATTPFQLRQRS